MTIKELYEELGELLNERPNIAQQEIEHLTAEGWSTVCIIKRNDELHNPEEFPEIFLGEE